MRDLKIHDFKKVKGQWQCLTCGLISKEDKRPCNHCGAEDGEKCPLDSCYLKVDQVESPELINSEVMK